MTNHFGSQLKAWRESKGLNIETLAELSSVSVEQIRYIETIESLRNEPSNQHSQQYHNIISVYNLKRIAEALHLDPFLFWSKEEFVPKEPDTIDSILNELDEDGPGTIVERLVRLTSHQVITSWYKAERIWDRFYDSDFNQEAKKITNLYCKCANCKSIMIMIANDEPKEMD